MAILPVLTFPHPTLKQVARAVEAVTPEIKQLMDDMLETMYHDEGVGLAAPQVGVLKRIIVMDLAEEGEKPAPFKMANPEIIWTSPETVVSPQACLSVPGVYAEVKRPKEVKISYLDEYNHPQELKADGILSVCIQHEIDHLNGILFIDHLSALKRQMVLKRLSKLKKFAG